MFLSYPQNDFLVPMGCPRVAQNNRIHFCYRVSEIGPESGPKSFGEMMTGS